MDNEKEIRDLLEEEIRSEIENLSKLTPGDKAHSDAVDSLVKLYKLNIEEITSEREFMRQSEESTNQDLDLRIKEEQLKEDVKNRYLRLGVEAAGIVLPLVFYGIWMNKGFKFEENGTFTSTTFRGLFNKFRPN